MPRKKLTKKKVLKKKVFKKAKHSTKSKKSDKGHLGWAALELSTRGESEKDINLLIDLIRKALQRPKLEIFVPVYYKSEEFFEKNVSFMDGYFFLKHEVGLVYHKLTETKYFQGVVAHPATKEVQIIPNEQILKIQEQFEEIITKKANFKVGHPVTIIDGLYKGLTAKIKRIYKKHKQCIVTITSLKSRNIEVSVPLVSIEGAEAEENVASVVTFFREDD